MHPSWRDLIIQELSADDLTRKSFLNKCEVNGFSLALSLAGGETGKITFPLLHTSDDWATLADSIPRILVSEYLAQWLVLRSLYSALFSTCQIDLKFVEVCLNALQEMWNSGKYFPRAAILETYYIISEKITPLPAGPNLQPIWKKSLKGVKLEVSKFDSSEIDFEFDEFENWLDMLVVIISNEPRFARQIAFPEKYTDMISGLLPKIQTRAELDIDLDTPDECAEEERRLDRLCEILEKISKSFSASESEAQKLLHVARQNMSRVERKREELDDEAAEIEEVSKPKRRNLASEIEPENKFHVLEEYVDIDSLFADL